MSEEFNFTKEDQTKAIGEIVNLINKYKLKIIIDHQIQIVPLKIKKEETPND